MKQLSMVLKGNTPLSLPVLKVLKMGLKRIAKQRQKRRLKGTAKDTIMEKLDFLPITRPEHYGIIKMVLVGEDEEIMKEFDMLNQALLISIEESCKKDPKLRGKISTVLLHYGIKALGKVKKVGKEVMIKLYSAVGVTIEYHMSSLEKLEVKKDE